MHRGNRIFLILGLVALGYSSYGLAGKQMTPKEECEELMNSVFPFAQQMLSKHREFYPFGGTTSIDGKIAHTASSTGEEHPASQPLIDLLERVLPAGMREASGDWGVNHGEAQTGLEDAPWPASTRAKLHRNCNESAIASRFGGGRD